jgi:hypothetical protein
LGEAYVAQLRKVFGARLADGADLVCFWFDKANRQLSNRRAFRAGLVATNSISGGSNRDVLTAIAKDNQLFEVGPSPWSVSHTPSTLDNCSAVAMPCTDSKMTSEHARSDAVPRFIRRILIPTGGSDGLFSRRF